MEEIRKAVSEHTTAHAFSLTFLLPLRWVLLRLSAPDFTPRFMSFVLAENPVNVAVGTLRRDLIAAQPKVLSVVRPRNIRVFHCCFLPVLPYKLSVVWGICALPSASAP